MAYSKQTWDTTSYVNPTRMNHIEQGIYDASIMAGENISVTLGQDITGNVNAKKFGRLVIVQIDSLKIPSGFGSRDVICTGLPKPTYDVYLALTNTTASGGNSKRVQIRTSDGAMLNAWMNLINSEEYFGFIAYQASN